MTERSRGTRLLYAIVMATGTCLFAFGSIGSLWSLITFVQLRTGWGLSEIDRCCSQLGKASLGGALASMFFILMGSAVILLLHPIRAHLVRVEGKRRPRWLIWFAGGLAFYSLASFVLATVLAGMAESLQGFATGIVTYCMLVGVGMLAAAWGFKRAHELV